MPTALFCFKVIPSKNHYNILSLIFDILRVKVYKPQDFQLVQTNSPANLYLDISVLFLLHICNFPLYNLHSFAKFLHIYQMHPANSYLLSIQTYYSYIFLIHYLILS